MKIPRLFLKSEELEGCSFILSESRTHYLKNVLRLMPDCEIIVVTPEGCSFTGIIDSFDGKCFHGHIKSDRILESHQYNKELLLRVAFPLLKGSRNDFTVEKLVETGAHELIPFISTRTVVREPGREKLERWKRLIETAALQAGRDIPPLLLEPVKLETLARDSRDELKILLVPPQRNSRLEIMRELVREILEKRKKIEDDVKQREGTEILKNPESCRVELPVEGQVQMQNIKKPFKVLVVSGPEGGFTPSEYEFLGNFEFVEICLGPCTLRADTAPFVAAAIFMYEFELAKYEIN